MAQCGSGFALDCARGTADNSGAGASDAANSAVAPVELWSRAAEERAVSVWARDGAKTWTLSSPSSFSPSLSIGACVDGRQIPESCAICSRHHESSCRHENSCSFDEVSQECLPSSLVTRELCGTIPNYLVEIPPENRVAIAIDLGEEYSVVSAQVFVHKWEDSSRKVHFRVHTVSESEATLLDESDAEWDTHRDSRCFTAAFPQQLSTANGEDDRTAEDSVYGIRGQGRGIGQHATSTSGTLRTAAGSEKFYCGKSSHGAPVAERHHQRARHIVFTVFCTSVLTSSLPCEIRLSELIVTATRSASPKHAGTSTNLTLHPLLRILHPETHGDAQAHELVIPARGDGKGSIAPVQVRFSDTVILTQIESILGGTGHLPDRLRSFKLETSIDGFTWTSIKSTTPGQSTQSREFFHGMDADTCMSKTRAHCQALRDDEATKLDLPNVCAPMGLDDGSLCPFRQVSNSPCFHEDCIDEDVDGKREKRKSDACLRVTTAYCELEVKRYRDGSAAGGVLEIDPACMPVPRVTAQCAYKESDQIGALFSPPCYHPDCAAKHNHPFTKACRTQILEHCKAAGRENDPGCNQPVHSGGALAVNLGKGAAGSNTEFCSFDFASASSPCHYITCREGGIDDANCRAYIAVYCKENREDEGCVMITSAANVQVSLDCDFDKEAEGSPCNTPKCRQGEDGASANPDNLHFDCRKSIQDYCRGTGLGPGDTSFNPSCELGAVERHLDSCPFTTISNAAEVKNPCSSVECRESHDYSSEDTHPNKDCRGKIRDHCNQYLDSSNAVDTKGCGFGTIEMEEVTITEKLEHQYLDVRSISWIEDKAEWAAPPEPGSITVTSINIGSDSIATIKHVEVKKLASYESLGSGYCSDYKYLSEGGYPAPLPSDHPLYNADPVQECLNRCYADTQVGTDAFYLNDADQCACAKGSCSNRVVDSKYTSYAMDCANGATSGGLNCQNSHIGVGDVFMIVAGSGSTGNRNGPFKVTAVPSKRSFTATCLSLSCATGNTGMGLLSGVAAKRRIRI